ncbi:MAG: helix-turn-helix transcriptional regulator [Deltaproteobacteria bacterium]|nr:helix-turn-helix transcriptional regulator [Deltaproteobacteria bacterium]
MRLSRVSLEVCYCQGGWTLAEAAEAFHTSKSAVWRAMRRYGIPRRRPGSRGARKLGPPEVSFIRDMLCERRFTQVELARMWHVSPSTISRIATGKLWPNVNTTAVESEFDPDEDPSQA